MSDMLVKLYDLPAREESVARARSHGITIRLANPHEKRIISEWVRGHFNESWALSCEVALEQRPTTCYIATQVQESLAPSSDPYDLPPEKLLGFACYDAGTKGMFGPMGVHPNQQGKGIGAALLLTALHAMREEGYVYVGIGWVGPYDFYAKTAGATVIPNSEPGMFRGALVG